MGLIRWAAKAIAPVIVEEIREHLTSEVGQTTGPVEIVEVSPELAVIVGPGPMPRDHVLKKLWEYIRDNDLQDTDNPRMIYADGNLEAVFDKDRVSMFEMIKKVNKHLS